MLEINSKDNPKIKLYKKLSDSHKSRLEHNMFVIEGVRLVEEAVKNGVDLDSLFITQTCLDKINFAYNNAFVISDEIAKKISDTKNPQGVFAICNMTSNMTKYDIVNDGKYILLHNIQDPGNMGTIIRTADAFGIDGVITVDCCDIYSPKVIRSTMGGIFKVRISNMTIEEAFAVFKSSGIKTFAAVADVHATAITDCNFDSGCAVLIGNEGNGLPLDIINMCDEKITIKMRGNAESLNASVAAGIIMYQLTIKQIIL